MHCLAFLVSALMVLFAFLSGVFGTSRHASRVTISLVGSDPNVLLDRTNYIVGIGIRFTK
jgi:hypothetical protein